jgi:cytochrome P450
MVRLPPSFNVGVSVSVTG